MIIHVATGMGGIWTQSPYSLHSATLPLLSIQYNLGLLDLSLEINLIAHLIQNIFTDYLAKVQSA